MSGRGAWVLAALLLAGCAGRVELDDSGWTDVSRLTTAPVERDPLEVDRSRLSDKGVDPETLTLPERPRPLLEIGDPYLGIGPISEGVSLPTGAVWQPSLIVFGTLRIAAATMTDADGAERAEVVSRLDLFGELRLTQTERLVLGLRPLDGGDAFAGYTLRDSGGDEGWNDAAFDGGFDAYVSALFFEGDFGELFPRLDPDDRGRLDVGFAVGRQRLLAQDRLLLDDTIDAVGLTRNNLQFGTVANLRLTALFGWGNVHRSDNARDGDALLWGLQAEADLETLTIDADLVLVTSGSGDGLYGGLGAVGRRVWFGQTVNTTLRAVASLPVGAETDVNRPGGVLFGELSTTPHGTDDNLYLNAFVGVGRYRAAARRTGGPLGRLGILFAATGLGAFGPALSNRADHAAGAALGYQRFFAARRQQVVIELGARVPTRGGGAAAGLGARWQAAVGQRHVVIVDGFTAVTDGGQPSLGSRLEWQIQF